MRWVVFVLFTVSFAHAAPLQYLTKTLVPETSFETTTTSFVSDYCTYCTYDDAVDRDVPIGFSFPFNGATYTTVNIDSNGILYFGNYNLTEYGNQTLPRTNRPQSIYPYWDDLNRNSDGTITYGVLGNASNRHFVVSWNNVPHYPNAGSYSFQVVLYEDGAIRFRYLSGSSANGASATIGVQEDNSPSFIDQHLYNSAILNQNQDILYLPNPIDVTAPPSNCTKVPKVSLSTYDTTGYNTYPGSAAQYQTLINNYATTANLFGSGYIDNITVSSGSNNNPYSAGIDSHYLAIFKGYIYLPDTGIYKFGIDGDDAVEVYIDGTLVTGWYGGHGRANHATRVKYVNATAGYHRIEYHMQERTGGDSYYLYWQPPSGSSIVIVPASQFFHCIPSISKISCVVDDPVNSTSNPKRIPGATIRYAIEVKNDTDNAIESTRINDSISSNFDTATIRNLQIQDGTCDCTGTASASNNGPNGTGNGVNPIVLDFGTINTNSTECGYFEVNIE